MTLTQNKQLNKDGFSIIEMIIVIAIIGAILGWIGPRVFGALQRAKVAGAKAELNTINSAIMKFHIDTNQYPSNLRDLIKRPADEAIASQWQGPYIQDKQVPVDKWNNRYVYKLTPGQEYPYELYSYGPKGRSAPKAEWISVKPTI